MTMMTIVYHSLVVWWCMQAYVQECRGKVLDRCFPGYNNCGKHERCNFYCECQPGYQTLDGDTCVLAWYWWLFITIGSLIALIALIALLNKPFKRFKRYIVWIFRNEIFANSRAASDYWSNVIHSTSSAPPAYITGRNATHTNVLSSNITSSAPPAYHTLFAEI